MPPNNTRAFVDDDAHNESDGDASDQLASNSCSEESSATSKDLLNDKKSDDSDEKTTDSDASETTAFGDASSDGDYSSKESDEGNNGSSKSKMLATAAALASLYAVEKHRQKKLTQVPLVMGQIPKSSQMESIAKKLTESNGILSRPIVPAMVVGTHAQLASAGAYMSRGPSTNEGVLRYSEILVSSYDGAEIVLKWEFPERKEVKTTTTTISHPTVLILHGINNSSKYGYIKNLQRTMSDRGWNAVAMNFRGCNGELTTPRSYTAAYTGDLRSAVNQLTGRMQNNTPLFLVGNSLGANLVTKYLGEEGLAGTLPANVLGGISLGNPFSFRSNFIGFPFGQVIGAARKMNLIKQRRPMSFNFQQSQNHVNHPSRINLASLDEALAPNMIRTEPFPPFSPKIGYGHAKRDNAVTSNPAPSPAEDYWADSSCYKQGRHVSVPLLHVVAQDDNLCHWSSQYLLGYSLQNSNVLFVNTKTGGHLGWWHSSKHGIKSWADEATADFIQAVLDTRNVEKTQNVASIDDAHNLYTTPRTHDSSESVGRTTRALPGDRDSDSTIATHSSYNRKNYDSNNKENSQSQTYFHYKEVLLLQQYKNEERIREKNRLIEKHESIELARLHRSRL